MADFKITKYLKKAFCGHARTPNVKPWSQIPAKNSSGVARPLLECGHLDVVPQRFLDQVGGVFSFGPDMFLCRHRVMWPWLESQSVAVQYSNTFPLHIPLHHRIYLLWVFSGIVGLLLY